MFRALKTLFLACLRKNALKVFLNKYLLEEVLYCTYCTVQYSEFRSTVLRSSGGGGLLNIVQQRPVATTTVLYYYFSQYCTVATLLRSSTTTSSNTVLLHYSCTRSLVLVQYHYFELRSTVSSAREQYIVLQYIAIL